MKAVDYAVFCQAPAGAQSGPGPSRLPAPSALLAPPNNMIGPGTDFGRYLVCL